MFFIAPIPLAHKLSVSRIPTATIYSGIFWRQLLQATQEFVFGHRIDIGMN
jgi:hypothetical protein